MNALRLYHPEEFITREEVRDRIKSDAAGRICGDCQFARLNEQGRGWCTKREGIGYYRLSPELAIHKREAVACNSWSAK